jgi:putative membrane protein
MPVAFAAGASGITFAKMDADGHAAPCRGPQDSAMHTADDRAIWRGVVAGVAGGAVAAWTMTQFQGAMTRMLERRDGHGQQSRQDGEPEPATEKAAAALTEPVIERKLTHGEKKQAGPIVHYAFGSAIGAAYGATAEAAPVAAAGRGLLFGSALWFGADEVAVPALGLSKPPLDYPPSTHLNALAAHLVYGLTADTVRRLVRWVM